jgi:hypothetical protein
VTPGEIGDDGTTDPTELAEERMAKVTDLLAMHNRLFGSRVDGLANQIDNEQVQQIRNTMATQAAQYRPEPSIPIRDAVPCMELAWMIATLPPALRHEVCAAFFMRFGAAGKRIDIAEFWKACDIPPE